MSALPAAYNDYDVEAALPADLRAARLLLGGVDYPRIRSHTFVARADVGVIAAASVLPGPLHPIPGLRIALSVAKPYRRQGIGSRFVARAIDLARKRQVEALYASRSIASGSDEHTRWRDLGFDATVKEVHLEANPHAVHAFLVPLRDQMQRLGRIPDDARVIPLAEASAICVADLHVRYLGGFAPAILARIEGDGPQCYDRQHSTVLMLGERVVGFLLAREIEPGIGMTEANVIIPELRKTWANVFLKAAAADRALQLRRRASRFLTFDQHDDTRRFARMVKAKVIESLVIPYRSFSPT